MWRSVYVQPPATREDQSLTLGAATIQNSYRAESSAYDVETVEVIVVAVDTPDFMTICM